jgi:SAM-dependent methyltransferase
MSSFGGDWLALREPADTAARSVPLTRMIAGVIGQTPLLRIVDLACGTGSNLRFLAPRLPAPQEWLLIDHDPSLLKEVPARMSSWAISLGYVCRPDGEIVNGAGRTWRFATRRFDLHALEDDLFAGRTLVTASALLDLVSDEWLKQLAACCRSSGASVLLALTYDGRMSCAPAETEDDEMVRDLVNQHQRTNKGFGPAVGPDAAERAHHYFENIGYHVEHATSDWALSSDPGDSELQRQLIAGWAEAAAEVAPERGRDIASWQTRRLEHVERSRSRLVVGHVDLAAWLT